MELIDSGAASAGVWVLLQAGLVVSLFLIVLAQPGFMMFVAGAGSRKNVIAAIYRSLAGVGVATISFLLVGRDIQNGVGPIVVELSGVGLAEPDALAPEPTGPRPGSALAPLIETGSALIAYAIAATATAGRATPLASALFAALFAGLVYPLIAFALDHPGGLLYGLLPNFAGAASLHVVGAGAALAGVLMLGPRLGFNGFDPINLGQDRLFRVAASHAQHHAPMTAQGAMMIWLGLTGVAMAALLGELARETQLFGAKDAIASALAAEERLAATLAALFLAPLGGLLATILAQWLFQRDLELMDLLFAAIAGLAALAPASAVATPEAAFVIGAAGAVAARLVRALLATLSVDDPLATVSTHGAAAVTGLGLAGFAAGLDDVSPMDAADAGLRAGYAFGLFVAAFVASIVVYKATELLCKLIAVALRRASLREALRGNQLRIDYEAEIFGLDETRHGQDAYTFRPLR